VPSFVEVRIGESLGNLPENFVAVFEQAKVVFVGFIIEVRLEGRNNAFFLFLNGDDFP